MILVIGGSRGTGRLIAASLATAGRPVRVLARNPGAARQGHGPSVDVVQGDITDPRTLPAAIAGATHIVFTAGIRSGHPALESTIKATEYDGLLNTLAAARASGFAGRFLYMTSSGVGVPSIYARALNIYKGNVLVWRLRAEEPIRQSGLDYTIIRAAFLLDRPGGQHSIQLTQQMLPLAPRYRIAREDVALAFVAALDHPRAARTTFEIAWGPRGPPAPWDGLLGTLKSDAPASS